MKILRVDSGADHDFTISRRLADRMTSRLAADGAEIVQRDVAVGLPFVDAAWVAANFGEGDPAGWALSDALIDELLSVDGLILVAPIYNFSIPAALKAWIDQVVRLGRTFDVTDSGPVGLATNVQRAWIITASSSTEIGGALDHATPYLRLVLATIGVRDVTVVGAGEWQTRGDAVIEEAHRFVDLACERVSVDSA
jgi:FMN-dependent NADH-azoreductase